MCIEKYYSQDLTDQDNDAYLQNYTKLLLFKKLHNQDKYWNWNYIYIQDKSHLGSYIFY